MKQKLSPQQKEAIEQFGANTWFVESLYEQFIKNPETIPEQWKKFFNGETNGKLDVAALKQAISGNGVKKEKEEDKDNDKEELKVIAGSSARILENMNLSLSVPTATSQRTIPVKLLEENRIIINQYLAQTESGKVSFTHLIAYAVVQALNKFPVMNNGFMEKDRKPHLVVRKEINLGLAIDIERKDGSRSLIVPNIKNAGELSFTEFVNKYEDIVKRTRSGQIDPSEFSGTTVTLTNPGTIGTVSSMPRLMVGQGTIVATGAIQYPAEYQAMSQETISTLGISKILNITSTYDHRIIQGAESGLFLKEIHELLLGGNDFYERIFKALKIPLKPIAWETDIQPGIFDKSSNTEEIEKQARVLQLINMYRVRGHLVARIDPLGANPVYHPELDPSFHKLTLWDLDRQFITGGFGGLKVATLRDILGILQRTYCDKIGVEYMHIQNHEEKTWLQQMMEPNENKPHFSKDEKKAVLQKLVEAEGFEHFIHTKFLGHKRFSLEGSETLIAVIDHLLNEASKVEVDEFVLGMAHRGRINVLVNILGKSYDSVLSEFEDLFDPDSIQGSGDVKYHLGASGTYKTRNGESIKVSVASNPSHLEWVNPVVEGIVRAKQNRKKDVEKNKTIPLLIHGDAAFAGQGVVAETLNLSQLKGYRTGGTIHLIINNQIGFTTTPEDARSSVYASDVAKMVQAPIFHVNGDDPEASLHVAKLALEYRQKFNKDVVIDLLGYRRHGHNEGDEPGYTQPLLYEKIKHHPSVMDIYSKHLIKKEVLEEPEYRKIRADYDRKLDLALERVKKKKTEFKVDVPLAVPKAKIEGSKPAKNTFVDEKVLNDIILKSTSMPDGFSIHPKLKKFMDKRRESASAAGVIDWAFAEWLAFGTLLNENIPIRLSGQDSVRGTFSQRHLALTDTLTGEEYFPLNNMFNKQARIEALDSLLSEAAILGFEFGYSIADPLTLVIWEAQFGDFANSAQVIIDNFIVASSEKWSVPSNLVLLLPHGFEGQGPEHSSARLERFLILCAQENMEVCYPTTPAQYFHLLRRQMKKSQSRPLVVMTPKSMLRLPEAKSDKFELTTGRFMEIIDDPNAANKSKIKRLILTGGKVYYDLLKYQTENKKTETAIIRVEQFYPFENDLFGEIVKSYSKANEVIWVQEEPGNMGAWTFLRERIFGYLKPGQKLSYAGRPASASPAVGSYKISISQQKQLIKEAFE